MKNYLLTALIGITAGVIDILPMLKMRLDKYSILSAFIYYLIVPFFIYNTSFSIIWWLKGGLISLVLAIPVMILVANGSKSSIPPMVVMSLVLGTLIGVAGHISKLM